MRTALKFLAAGMLMALIAAVSVTSLTQDVPSASAAQADYFLKIEGIEGEIEIQSFSWGVSSPRDSATGQSTGRRQYQPLVIRKRIDKASPLLFRAINDGKRTGHVTIIRRSSDGQPDYQVTFQDVFVSSFENKGDESSEPVETVSFTYQKIEWK